MKGRGIIWSGIGVEQIYMCIYRESTAAADEKERAIR